MFFCIYQVTSGVLGGGRAWRGPAKILEGPGLFDLKGSLWFPLLDLWNKRLIKALEIWSLYAKRPCPQIEVIFPNKLADPLGVEILEL